MKLPILIHPDPAAEEGRRYGSGPQRRSAPLADDMLETMYDAPGIGLAAPQIGVSKRLIVLDCVKEEGAAPRPIAMFNPEVVASSDETSVYEEGCLSIPETFADVTRPAEVTVRWMDRGREPCGGNLRRPLGDLRAARDRPPERQALHRLPDRAQAPVDHPQDGQAEEGTRPRAGGRVSLLPIRRWPDPILSRRARPLPIRKPSVAGLPQ
jgi:peptide deformylase